VARVTALSTAAALQLYSWTAPTSDRRFSTKSVKLLDANIVFYAYNRAPHHDNCRVWLEAAFNAAEPRASCIPIQTFK
jgi:hypothetical protein